MRWLITPLLLSLVLAPSASAAPIVFQAELAIVFAEGGLGTISATASGTAEVNLDTLAAALPAGLFELQGTLPGPATGPIGEVRVDGGNAAGTPGRSTLLISCPLVACPPVSIPQPGIFPLTGSIELILRDGSGTVTLPLSVIGAGSPTLATGATAQGFGGFLNGGAWTDFVATAPFGPPITPPLPGTPPSTTTFTGTVIPIPPAQFVVGSDTRNEFGIGRLQRVTPMHIILGDDYRSGLSGYGRLTIDFVPEPAPLALLGAGLVGLGWMLRRATPRR